MATWFLSYLETADFSNKDYSNAANQNLKGGVLCPEMWKLGGRFLSEIPVE
jgi:hypothetical protein